MAKKLEKNVEVMVDVPEVNAQVNSEVEVKVDTTPVPEVKEVAPVEKNVKIRPNKNHTCHIGGEYYYFERGKYYNVPQNVKFILENAGLLMPL